MPALLLALPGWLPVAPLSRRSLRLAQSSEGPATTIDSLSDDLLAKCFSSLEQKDLLTRAALVCPRWHAVSVRPELLRNVEFSPNWAFANLKTTAAHSLLRWMQLYGSGVRSLRLNPAHCSSCSADEKIEMGSLLDSCISVCASSLERLELSLHGQSYTVSGWVATANLLEEMALRMPSCTVWNTLEHHTCLKRLTLTAEDLRLGPSVALPSSLTFLCLCNHRGPALPSQVAALTNLCSLSLADVKFSAAGMACLTRLRGLRRIRFNECVLPDCLPELTHLEVLDAWFPEYETSEGDMSRDSLNAVLPQLTQLTGLRIEDFNSSAGAIQPFVAGLSRLQWLYWSIPSEQPAILPLGPWQRSLRHLAADFDLVHRSLPFLRGAERLERIISISPRFLEPGSEEQWQAFWSWAAEHPSLECIGFPTKDCDGFPIDGTRGSAEVDLLKAIQALKQRRPTLRIETNFSFDDIFEDLVQQWR